MPPFAPSPACSHRPAVDTTCDSRAPKNSVGAEKLAKHRRLSWHYQFDLSVSRWGCRRCWRRAWERLEGARRGGGGGGAAGCCDAPIRHTAGPTRRRLCLRCCEGRQPVDGVALRSTRVSALLQMVRQTVAADGWRFVRRLRRGPSMVWSGFSAYFEATSTPVGYSLSPPLAVRLDIRAIALSHCCHYVRHLP